MLIMPIPYYCGCDCLSFFEFSSLDLLAGGLQFALRMSVATETAFSQVIRARATSADVTLATPTCSIHPMDTVYLNVSFVHLVKAPISITISLFEHLLK